MWVGSLLSLFHFMDQKKKQRSATTTAAVPMPVLLATRDVAKAETTRNRSGVIHTRQQQVEEPNTREDQEPDAPIVQVLPLNTRVSFLASSKLESPDAFPDGILAWGDLQTAQKYSHLFDALIITAEEFNLTNQEFLRRAFAKDSRCKGGVYSVPISEEPVRGNEDILSYRNMLSQEVYHITRGQRTDKLSSKPLKTGRDSVRSPRLIYSLLLEKKRVLVVCMAGRNRSTATLLLFLMLMPHIVPTAPETDLLSAVREKVRWSLSDWHSYLFKKRITKVFQLNRIQLESLDASLQLLRMTS